MTRIIESRVHLLEEYWTDLTNWDPSDQSKVDALNASAPNVNGVYIARAGHSISPGLLIPNRLIYITGKFLPKYSHAYISYGGKEYTEHFFEIFVYPHVDWLKFDWSTSFPSNMAVVGARDSDDEFLYIGRKFISRELSRGHEPNWSIGKVSQKTQKLYIPWYGLELEINDTFEILVWNDVEKM